MTKYVYNIVKHNNERSPTADTNRLLELMSGDWQFYDWKITDTHTILLFRKEVTHESNTK